MVLKLFVLLLAASSAFCAPKGSENQSSAQPKIVRPCHLNDYRCIADNLSANSKCNKKVIGSIPEVHTVYNFRFETPFFNASYVDNVLLVGNHNKCFVSEFFFNLDADTGILALDCPNLRLHSKNRTLYQHYSLKEDSVYNYNIDGLYPLVRMTASLKHADKLDVCSAFVFTDVTALPIFKVNPLDKPTANFLSHDLRVLNVFERETFFYRGPAIFRDFVNAYICNFGCK